MRRFALACCTATLAACAPSDDGAADTASARNVARNPIAPADLAGHWQMRAFSPRGDTLTMYQLDAPADTAAWTITFRNRPPIPLRVLAVAGDSIVTEAGPYPSVLQQNVAVRSLRAVNRLEGDRLVGTFVARYDTDAADSVLYGRHEGTRRP